MLITSNLDGCICGFICLVTGREREPGEDRVRREIDQRDGLGSELAWIGGDDNLLDAAMRGLDPFWSEGSHFDLVFELELQVCG